MVEDDVGVEGGFALLDSRYELADRLGGGGMAEVYRAHDKLLDRTVAVKVMRPGLQIPNAHARFLRETRTLAQLRHPNLVTLLDAGTTDDRPFLVMELVEGTTLEDQEARPPAVDEVAKIGHGVASALAHVHKNGIVHRDVKPGNILLAADGRILLSDFGIAKLLDDSGAVTQTMATLGSPPYLSPEQVRGEGATYASDVYSLGLVLLEALTGRRAFQGPAAEAAVARLSSPPEIPGGLSEEWRRLISEMCSDAEQSRPTAERVEQRLQTMVAAGVPGSGAQPVDAAGDTRPLTIPMDETKAGIDGQGGTSRSRHSLALAVSIGALLLMVGVIAVVTATRGTNAGSSDLPNDLPPRISDRLDDLHHAVEGTP